MALDLMEIYTDLSDTLKDIDKKLDSRDDGTSSIRSSIIDEKVEATKENWTKVSESIISQLVDAPTEVQVGFYYGLARALDKAYSPEAKKFVDELVATTPKPTPLIEESEVPELTEQRKEVYAKIKAVMDMAETFGDDSFKEMNKPRRRGGAPKGKRGPRAISFFKWNIDDKDYEKLSEVIEDLPWYGKVSELTAAMKANKINTTKPPAEIDFELPDGRILHGESTNVSSEVEGDEDPDPDAEEDNESEEVTVLS